MPLGLLALATTVLAQGPVIQTPAPPAAPPLPAEVTRELNQLRHDVGTLRRYVRVLKNSRDASDGETINALGQVGTLETEVRTLRDRVRALEAELAKLQKPAP